MSIEQRCHRTKFLLNSFEAEAGFAQGVADGGDVGGAAGFEGDVDDGFAEADAVVGAVVDGLDDVGALAGEDLGEVEERAGAVLQIDADAQQAAIFDEAALDDLGEQRDVDVAAADEDDGAAMAEIGFGLHDCGEGGGAGAFGEGLFLFEQHEDGAGDFFVVDGDDFVDVAGDEGKVTSPARRTAMPSAMVASAAMVTGAPASRARSMEGRRSGSTPTTRILGLVSLSAQAMPAMRPPPPMGTTTASMSGTCSSSSRPMVPWPEMTSGSSKGWMKVRPSSTRRRRASSQASS